MCQVSRPSIRPSDILPNSGAYVNLVILSTKVAQQPMVKTRSVMSGNDEHGINIYHIFTENNKTVFCEDIINDIFHFKSETH